MPYDSAGLESLAAASVAGAGDLDKFRAGCSFATGGDDSGGEATSSAPSPAVSRLASALVIR